MIADDQPNYSFDPNEIRIDYTTLTPRFSVVDNQSLDEGIRYLAEHGYAVFSDVMNQEEINHNKDLLWKFLENIPHTRIDRNNPSTWSKHWYRNFDDSFRMICLFVFSQYLGQAMVVMVF